MNLALHLRIVPFTGTAKHLAAVHGLPADQIDKDDPHGLAHDHVVLHGLTVTEQGRYWVPSALLLAGLLLIIAGCSTPVAVADHASPESARASAVAAAGSLHEADFLRLTRQDVPSLAGRTDTQLDAIANGVCGVLVVGDKSSWPYALKPLLDAGLTGTEAGAFVAYAAAAYCPVKMSALP